MCVGLHFKLISIFFSIVIVIWFMSIYRSWEVWSGWWLLTTIISRSPLNSAREFKKASTRRIPSYPNSRLEFLIDDVCLFKDIPVASPTETWSLDVIHWQDWGVDLMTLHGRSRQQRYTRQADWDYIHTCAQVASPVPFFGNGDVYSMEEYNRHRYGPMVWWGYESWGKWS